MKINTYLIIVILALLLPGTMLAQKANSTDSIIAPVHLKSVVFGIDGMACQEGCANKIAENLENTKGIHAVNVSFNEKTAGIDYNPSIISLTDLKSIITNTKVKQYQYTITSTTLKE